MDIFLLGYNSCSSEAFVGSSCKLNSDGGLILLLCSSACYFLIYVKCTHAELHQSPYFIMHFKFFISYVSCMNYKI